jgi:putative transposase
MVMNVSERRVCRVADRHRSTQRRPVPPNPYWDRLVARMRELAVEHPRRGHRHVMDLLHKERWTIGTRLMKCLWRTEGLLVPQKRSKRRRIGTGENGIVRRRATRKDDVWGMDFVSDHTADDRPLRILGVLDECTRECLAIEVGRHRRAWRGWLPCTNAHKGWTDESDPVTGSKPRRRK